MLLAVVAGGVERRKVARQLHLAVVGDMLSVGSESIMEIPGWRSKSEIPADLARAKGQEAAGVSLDEVARSR